MILWPVEVRACVIDVLHYFNFGELKHGNVFVYVVLRMRALSMSRGENEFMQSACHVASMFLNGLNEKEKLILIRRYNKMMKKCIL